MVRLLHLYMTTGKTMGLTRRTFIGKVISLLFNTQVCHNFPSKEQMPFNFVVAVTIHSDFGAQENKVCHCFHFFPHLFTMKWWDRMLWSLFFECWVLNQVFTLLFHCHQEVSASLLSTFKVVSSAYLRLLIFLLAILIPACDSPSPSFAWCFLHRN